MSIIPGIRVKGCDGCCFNLCPFSEQYQCTAPEGPKDPFDPLVGTRHTNCPIDKHGEVTVLPDETNKP